MNFLFVDIVSLHSKLQRETERNKKDIEKKRDKFRLVNLNHEFYSVGGNIVSLRSKV